MLEGKIAAIVDEESVVINLGSEHGVKPGMKFVAVYETESIVNPDNPDETLGGLTFEIAKLEAANVQRKMTYCTILNPYHIKTVGLESLIHLAPQQRESKVDPRARMIGSPRDLKLKAGTAVREAPEESEKDRSAQKDTPK